MILINGDHEITTSLTLILPISLQVFFKYSFLTLEFVSLYQLSFWRIVSSIIMPFLWCFSLLYELIIVICFWKLKFHVATIKTYEICPNHRRICSINCAFRLVCIIWILTLFD